MSVSPKFFASPEKFRAWLARHHLDTSELLVGFYKRDSGRASMTWPESVDQALCYGWIDGVRRRIDDESYSIRFTPRRANGTWSTINIDRVAELTAQGLMQPAGAAAFNRRVAKKSRIYSYEQSRAAVLEPEQLKALRANRKAWTFFEQQAPSWQRTVVYRIASAKASATKARRLAKLIEESAAGRRW